MPALSAAGGEDRNAAAVEDEKRSADATPTRWSQTPEAERAAQVLRQFRLQLNPGLRTATIHLSPANLGRIAIRLTVKDGRVSAVVRAETEETLNVLQRHLPELEASFAQQDMQLDEFDLELGFGAETGRGAKGFSLDPETGPSAEHDPPIEVEIDPTQLARALARKVGVDTYA